MANWLKTAILAVLAVLAAVSPAPAAVIGDDGRGPLASRAADLRISGDEVARLRAATGYIVCPGDRYKNGIVASAALVLSDRLLLTVGHAFVDEAGRAREPLTACVFRSQAPVPVEVPILPETLQLGLPGSAKVHSPVDYAVVALARPVRGAAPLPLRLRPVQEDEAVVGLVAWQEMKGRSLDPDMPVAQDCTIRRIEPSAGDRPTNYLTDCDLSQVGSGGQVLTRIEGQWAVTGVFSSSASAKADGKAFDVKLGRYTRAIGVDGGVTSALERVLAGLRR